MMLVLARNVDELVWVGNDVAIRISKVVGGKVWLAIDAPPDVVVDRHEVRARKLAQEVQKQEATE